MSPLRPTAVSSAVSLVSPMGLVPLQGPRDLRVCLRSHRAGARCRLGRSATRRQAVGASTSASPSQRIAVVRAAASLLGFSASSRPPAEAVTADDALSREVCPEIGVVKFVPFLLAPRGVAPEGAASLAWAPR